MQFKSKFEGPWGTPEQMRELKTGEWRFQRPVVKVDKCRQCGWCYLFCSVNCIEEEETHFSPNLDYCKGCGICARICPARAIKMVREEFE